MALSAHEFSRVMKPAIAIILLCSAATASMFEVPLKSRADMSKAAETFIDALNYANVHRRWPSGFEDSFDSEVISYMSAVDRNFSTRDAVLNFLGANWVFKVNRFHITQDWSVGSRHQVVFGTTTGGRLHADDNSCLFTVECGWHMQFNEAGHITHLSAVWDTDFLRDCGIAVERKNRALEPAPNAEVGRHLVNDMNAAMESFFNAPDGSLDLEERHFADYVADNAKITFQDNHLTGGIGKSTFLPYLRTVWGQGTSVWNMGSIQRITTSGQAVVFHSVAHGFAEGADCHMIVPYAGVYFYDNSRRIVALHQVFGEPEEGRTDGGQMLCTPPPKEEL
eukprot:m.135624 g.135624  ORF g.135624 m.135624 type:complete len:337 (-) comp17559_c0_seq1:251-1261(-)